MTATVDQQKCLRCGICTQVCFGVASSWAHVGELPELAREDTCIECGHCEAVCPVEAVQLEGYATEPVKTERLPAPDQVLELIRSRRSIRCFLERPVERDLLLELIEAARFAPSATNIQSTEYIVVTDPGTVAEASRLTTEFFAKTVHQLRNPLLRQALRLVAPNELAAIMPYLDLMATFSGRLRQGEDPILYGAPVLIVFHSRPDVNFPAVNASFAAHNSALYAESLGLGALFAGFFVGACGREPRLPRLLGVPSGHRVYAALAIGYPKFQYQRWVERRKPRVTWIEG